MGNCLKTQLKEVVNNNNLPELGIIKIPVINTNGSKGTLARLGGYSVDQGIIVSIGDGSLYNYNSDTSLGNETSEWNGNLSAKQYIANTDTFIRIKNKYNLKGLSFYKYIEGGNVPADYVFQLDEISKCQHLTYFGGDFDMVGDLEKALKLCSNLQFLEIRSGSITGEIKNIVASLINNSGQTTGIIPELIVIPETTPLYNASYVNITFNGTVLDTKASSQLVWESASKIYITIGGAWNQVYCVGYTDGEIATNVASGGIWEGKTVIKYD